MESESLFALEELMEKVFKIVGYFQGLIML